MTKRSYAPSTYDGETRTSQAQLFGAAQAVEHAVPELAPILDRLAGLVAAFPAAADVHAAAVAALRAGKPLDKTNTASLALQSIRSKVMVDAEAELISDLRRAVHDHEAEIIAALSELAGPSLEVVAAVAELPEDATTDRLLGDGEAGAAELLIKYPAALANLQEVTRVRHVLLGGVPRMNGVGIDYRPSVTIRATTPGVATGKDLLYALRSGRGTWWLPTRAELAEHAAEIEAAVLTEREELKRPKRRANGTWGI